MQHSNQSMPHASQQLDDKFVGSDDMSWRPFLSTENHNAYAYPLDLVKPLRYTCLLPFATMFVACARSFFVLTAVSSALGVTSVLWWFNPVATSIWRTVDKLSIVVCAIYIAKLACMLHDVWRWYLIISFMLVGVSIAVNELLLAFGMKHADASKCRDIVRRNLYLHAALGHVLYNCLLIIFLIAYQAPHESSH